MWTIWPEKVGPAEVIPTVGNRSPTASGANGYPPVMVHSPGEPQKTEDAVSSVSYKTYLGSLCRPLTPAEEDRIAAESKHDPRILAGLALTGSLRAKEWLEEALRQAPDDPLVLYSILARMDTGFDRLMLARKFVKLVPDDAEPLYAAANEALKAGDRNAAIAFLREAAGRENYSSLYQAGVDAKLNVYRLAGYSEQNALARIYLDDGATLADFALIDLNNTFEPFDRAFVISPGNEEVAALLLDGMQKASSSPGRTLASYEMASQLEFSYLRAFTRSSVGGDNPIATARYLATPAAEMLAQANAERQEFYPVGYFAHDKPGVYQRLTSDEQIELLQRVQRDGELPAYQWAYQLHPNIFRSPDFVPRGFSQKFWIENFQMTTR